MVAAGLVGGITCFISITVVSFAPTVTDDAEVTVAKDSVKLAVAVVVLVTKILVITVVTVVLGCVYRVVLVVAAAVLASVLDVTAISYCTFLLVRIMRLNYLSCYFNFIFRNFKSKS
jgi:hypothetical protein